jgi:hypothetical protein
MSHEMGWDARFLKTSHEMGQKLFEDYPISCRIDPF